MKDNAFRRLATFGLEEDDGDKVPEKTGFSQILTPHYNGRSLLDKSMVPSRDQLEIDACLT